jgi:hypothetical protein
MSGDTPLWSLYIFMELTGTSPSLWYDKIYLTAIGLTPDGSGTVHIYTQTVQLIWEECGPCHIFAGYTLAFALQLRKKHGKTSARVAEEGLLARWKKYIQNREYVTIKIHKHNNKNTQLTELTFRHRASCILGQAFHYCPDNAFYIFNQQMYFITWYLLDRASLISII